MKDEDKVHKPEGKECDTDGSKMHKERLCNGEIFFIVQVKWKY